MLRVALISPLIPPAPMNFAYSMELVGCAFSHIPLPLATIAALTPAGMPVQILDENVEPVDPARIEAEVVGLTGIYCQRERLFQIADALRARGVIVAIGGPIAEDIFDECRRHADVLFVGEAEYTWPRFCAEVQEGRQQPVYRQPEWVDMADSPMPRFDLLQIGRYSSGCVQATRGCTYQCEYCDVPAKQGSRPRSKPVANVLAEVRRLVELGCGAIFFVDDNFTGNRRYAKDLLEALARLLPTLPHPVYFYTQVTLNIARDEELLELFHAASFRRFFIGIETPCVEKLRAMDKAHNTELDLCEAIHKIQSYNITVWAGLMLGLDQDGPSTFDEQFRFVMDAGITPTLVGLLQAMPGAPLYARAIRESRLRPLPDIVGSGAVGSIEAQGQTNLVPLGMERGALLAGFGDLVRRIYAPEAYGRCLLAATARGKRAHPSVWSALTTRNLKVLLRLLRYYLKDGDPALRRMFVRLLLTTALRRGRALEEIVFHLVIYKHLREFYDQAAEVARAAS